VLAFLRVGDVDAARDRLAASKSVEAQVAAAGLANPEDGAASAEERIAGATHVAKIRMERRLAFLGTLGANAPFIGLLGTVIGIIRAFAELNEAAGKVTAGLMSEVGEALVATAIGIMVAIPAIAVFNAYQRVIKTRLARAESLGREVMAYLRSDRAPQTRPSPDRHLHPPSTPNNGDDAMATAAQDNDEMITSINVTPLVDITLVLLIILMITASYVASKAIPLDLPKGATAETTPVTLSVSIDKDGKTYLEAAPIDDAGLRAKVRAARASDPETRAVIAADGRAAHSHVVHVMDLLRREEVTKFAINVDPEDVGTPLPNPLPASRGEGTGR
jgi:biopolymer transport protein ExbB